MRSLLQILSYGWVTILSVCYILLAKYVFYSKLKSNYACVYGVCDFSECGLVCQNGGAPNAACSICECLPGFNESSCQTDIDECLQNPCQNGGNCSDDINSFICLCQPGFTGSTCGNDIDDCSPNPCQNGGNCTDGLNYFTCTCPPGFTGSSCETNIDECSPNPCQNGGNCIDGISSFACQCLPEYTGSSCQDNADDCSLTVCENGGTSCINTSSLLLLITIFFLVYVM